MNTSSNQIVSSVDVCIVGGGIVGLSLALELKSHGLSVLVLEKGQAMHEASWAAAGMLAVLDPSNPSELLPLANLSLNLYPEYLQQLSNICGEQLKFRTKYTLLASNSSVDMYSEKDFLSKCDLYNLVPNLNPGHYKWRLLDEPSIAPRDLCVALTKAIQVFGIEMREKTAWLSTSTQINRTRSLKIQTTNGQLDADVIVHCTGAWAASAMLDPVDAAAKGLRPRKGQMVSLALPEGCSLSFVVHAPGCYIVPRGDGRVIVGATIEDCSFDKSTNDADIDNLLSRAAQLVPALANATEIERWAGLRPGSPDGLPVLGSVPSTPKTYVAAGHFRMGILLAPATARVMAQLILGEQPEVDLQPFSPLRLRSLNQECLV